MENASSRSHNVYKSTRRRIFSKLIIKPPERRVLTIANFEHILQPPVYISWVCIKVLFPICTVNNYLFKVNNRKTEMMWEIWTLEQRCIAIKTPERDAGWFATS